MSEEAKTSLDVHREESRARWNEHRRDHELLEADLVQRDREVNEKILAAMSTLIRHEEQMKAGVGSFASLRAQQDQLAADIELLKPRRKSWKQLGAVAAGFVVTVAGAGWISASTILARPTFEKTRELIDERVRVPNPETSGAIDRVVLQVNDVKQEQSAMRQQVQDVKDDVREIKSDLKEALRRGR